MYRRVHIWINSQLPNVYLHRQDLRLIDCDLTARMVVEILACDDPKVTDCQDAVNLELEVITFLSGLLEIFDSVQLAF